MGTRPEGQSAVEMPGPRKTWKTRLRFPTFPTAPWKSPKARFPHPHRADDDSLIKITTGLENANQKKACRNHLRQGINQVFWVGLLWPVLK
jgi:hypothetical protein